MLGAKIRQIRRAKDIPQSVVALKLGLKQCQISKIESNLRKVDATELKALADILGVSINELLDPS